MTDKSNKSNKLTKVLTIGKVQVITLVNDIVQLDLFSAGRASFVVVTENEPTGLVELQIGYNINNVTPYFLGVIESKYFHNGKWYLTCRELLGAMSFNAPMAIRFATAEQVLNELSKLGLEFITPQQQYITTPVACFYHKGDGIAALRQLGEAFNITNYIFQQRPDGKIYVGSWNDSGWATSTVDGFQEHVITPKTTNTGELVAIPKLRPGLKLNGRYITEVTLMGNKQVIQWQTKL